MVWWIWVLAGFALLAIEMASTTMHVGFFGLGAFIEGLIVALGFGGPLWAQILTVVIVSLVLLFFVRPPLMKRLKLNEPKVVDTLVGEAAIAIETLGPGAIGKAEMRGSTWNAMNTGTAPLLAGQRARVERVDGLTIYIRSDQ